MATTTTQRVRTSTSRRAATPQHMRRRAVARRFRIAELVAKLLGSEKRLAYMELPSLLTTMAYDITGGRADIAYTYMRDAERLDYSALKYTLSSLRDNIRSAATKLQLLTQQIDSLYDYACTRLDMDVDSEQRRAREQKELTDSIYASLTCMEESKAFAHIEYNLRPPIITVTTPGITLEGTDDEEGMFELGAFSIKLELNKLAHVYRNDDTGRQSPYSVTPLTPIDGTISQGHPHVSSNRLCEGEASNAIRFALSRGMIGEFFAIVYATLQTYNPESAYIPLSELAGNSDDDDDDDTSVCMVCDATVNNDDTYVCDCCGDTVCTSCISHCTCRSRVLCARCSSRTTACRVFGAACSSFGGQDCLLDQRVTCGVCGESVLSSTTARCSRGDILLCATCRTVTTACLIDGQPCPAHNRARCLRWRAQ